MLVLDPPTADGYTNESRLEALMLKSLVGQTHTLWDSINCCNELGVVGPTYKELEEDKDGDEGKNEGEENATTVTAQQVLHAIQQDLFSYPGFKLLWGQTLLEIPPPTYVWPPAPKGSHPAEHVLLGLQEKHQQQDGEWAFPSGWNVGGLVHQK
ncbi:hypothetical protein GYMLUDRAFT_246135 [Collybiopsis luxurians FD-317 M1]|uniref:Unplaced genomic scaffold GYMLUscaffold_37, whole genome shotgun sequence n=1 Tax=Collybiopsis luxurians FD-317 M1 TaxID=944289 RepID=A0A0D0B524_9AGAR|nr:hypothetical protein GYMLUDRAFT_246135 [Collybiopsis luxurians FD-317 M1]